MSPEMIHVLFTLAGLALGWFAKTYSLPTGLIEILPALEQVFDRKKLQDAHATLQGIAEAAKASTATAPPKV